jgi:hypothetical protein
MKFVNYRWNVHKSENYHDVMLKSIYPFVYVIEPAVRIFAFEQYRQWDTCQQESEGDFENCVQGKREDPSKK